MKIGLRIGWSYGAGFRSIAPSWCADGKETLKRSWQVAWANFPIDLPFLLANWLDLLACELRGFRLDDWGLQSL